MSKTAAIMKMTATYIFKMHGSCVLMSVAPKTATVPKMTTVSQSLKESIFFKDGSCVKQIKAVSKTAAVSEMTAVSKTEAGDGGCVYAFNTHTFTVQCTCAYRRLPAFSSFIYLSRFKHAFRNYFQNILHETLAAPRS